MSDLASLNVGQIREKARVEAARVLELHWASAQLPVDPIHVARQLGASVFSAQLGDDAWGMLVGSSTGADIYLDKDQPTTRFRFSCAHEIGHLVDRGAELEAGVAFVEKRSEAGRGTAEEVFANEFAASLLMPEDAFRRARLAGEDKYDLAERFHVSIDAATWRIRHLAL